TGFELGLKQVQIEKIIENTSGLVTSSDSSENTSSPAASSDSAESDDSADFADSPDNINQKNSSDSSDSTNTENNSKREKSTDFQSIERFFDEEKKSLLELKDILTGKKSLPEREAQTEILKIISEREYLYLHFADGNRARLSLDFLKRVRAESDYFLKIFQ
ncbi:MAG: hypothetical protein K6E78_07505, partial [Treponema sp.]|nr:hypothetical protein [Treponema sp.]